MKLAELIKNAPSNIRETIKADSVAAGEMLVAWGESMEPKRGDIGKQHRRLRSAAIMHGERLASGAVVGKRN